MFLRITFFLFTLAFAHFYVAASFYAATERQEAWWIVALLFTLEMFMIPLRWGSWQNKRSNKLLLRALWLASFMALGVFSLLFFFSAVRDILFLIIGFFNTSLSAQIISFTSIKIQICMILAIVIIGVIQALKGPRIQQIHVPISHLPKAFEGFRIAQISDLHIGPTIGQTYVRDVVQKTNTLNADIIVFTGDITDGSPEELLTSFKELTQLKSKYGQFFVTGNHEYYHDAMDWIPHYKDIGLHVLINECHVIQKSGAQIAILGLPDVTAHRFVPTHTCNIQAAIRNVPSDTVKILLAHQPSSYKQAEPAGVSLQLSGHTHGGQFFPWNLVIGFFHRFYRGLNRYKNMWIYVNPGTGYWGPPLRTGIPAEITLLVLGCAAE